MIIGVVYDSVDWAKRKVKKEKKIEGKSITFKEFLIYTKKILGKTSKQKKYGASEIDKFIKDINLQSFNLQSFHELVQYIKDEQGLENIDVEKFASNVGKIFLDNYREKQILIWKYER